MKDKNLPDDIETKSLEELNNLVNKIIDDLENKNLEDFVQEYQELIKLNNYIEKKFQYETRSISKKTKDKIDQIINYGKKTKKDFKRGKATIISLLGYENAVKYTHKLKKNIFTKLKVHSNKANDLRETIEFIIERKK